MIKQHTTIESELLIVKLLHLHEQHHYFVIYLLIICCTCITIHLCLVIHSGQIWRAGICFCHACMYFTILLVYKKGQRFCYKPHYEIWFNYLMGLLGKLILVCEITLMFLYLIYFYNLVLNADVIFINHGTYRKPCKGFFFFEDLNLVKVLSLCYVYCRWDTYT